LLRVCSDGFFVRPKPRGPDLPQPNRTSGKAI
jgi:hypothetical protein